MVEWWSREETTFETRQRSKHSCQVGVAMCEPQPGQEEGRKSRKTAGGGFKSGRVGRVYSLSILPASPLYSQSTHLSSFIFLPYETLQLTCKILKLQQCLCECFHLDCVLYFAANILIWLFRFWPLVRLYIDFIRLTAWASWLSHIPSLKWLS